jgi:hypothetical protein
VQGSLAKPKVKISTVQLNPSRKCMKLTEDGFGAQVSTHASKRTLFSIKFLFDGRFLDDQVDDTRFANTSPHILHRGRHTLKVVVSDAAVHDTVTKTVRFREC